MADIKRIKSLRILEKKNPHQIALKTNHSWATVVKYLDMTPDDLLTNIPEQQLKFK